MLDSIFMIKIGICLSYVASKIILITPSQLTPSEEAFLRNYAGVVHSQMSQLPQHNIDQGKAGTQHTFIIKLYNSLARVGIRNFLLLPGNRFFFFMQGMTFMIACLKNMHFYELKPKTVLMMYTGVDSQSSRSW